MNLPGADFWNNRFNSEDFLFGVEPNEFLREVAPQFLVPKSNILCVADGEGRNSCWLAQQNHQVDAFDFSEIAIQKAKKLASHLNVDVQFSVSDCQSWDWQNNQYDAVVAIFIQFAPPEMRKLLFANMMNCLNPGGILILQGYTPLQLNFKTGGPSQVENLYTSALIQELLSGQDILILKEYQAVLSEGSGHSGPSALLGLVARKIK